MVSRRVFLAMCGATAPAVAGCVGASRDSDGYPESTGSVTPRVVDTSQFSTVELNGVDVTQAPLDVAHYWYQRREARFLDARGRIPYRRARVRGAAWSPAVTHRDDDPVDGWPRGDRIVSYCDCPVVLSGLRAISLMEDGFEEVYILEGGFQKWREAGYPVAGEEVGVEPSVWILEGIADRSDSGELVWLRHAPTDQREAAVIGPDGRFRMRVQFWDVSDRTTVTIESPGGVARMTLGELASAPLVLEDM